MQENPRHALFALAWLTTTRLIVQAFQGPCMEIKTVTTTETMFVFTDNGLGNGDFFHFLFILFTYVKLLAKLVPSQYPVYLGVNK